MATSQSYYSLKEVANRTGLPLQRLRQYQRENPDLIPTSHTQNGKRYPSEALAAFLRIDYEKQVDALRKLPERLADVENRLFSLESATDGEEQAEAMSTLRSDLHVLQTAVKGLSERINLEEIESKVLRLADTADNLVATALAEGELAGDLEWIQALYRGFYPEDEPPHWLGHLQRRLDHVERLLHQSRTKDRSVEQRVQKALSGTGTLHDLQPTHHMTPEELCSQLQQEEFFLNLATATKILTGLRTHRILVLEGPPGSGKSRLTRLLSRTFGTKGEYTEISLGPDVTTYDLIGGMGLRDGSLVPHLGSLTDAILRSFENNGVHWLILDEINRADISRILDPILASLTLQDAAAIRHPFIFQDSAQPSARIPMPGSFRILGSINTIDKEHLYSFSNALARRVAFVPVLQPERSAEKQAILLRLHQGSLRSNPAAIRPKQIDAHIEKILRLAGRLRSISSRPPMREFRVCNVSTGLLISIAETFLQHAISSPAGSRRRFQTALDHAFSDCFLSQQPIHGYELLHQLSREVFQPEWAFPECTKKLSQIKSRLLAY